MTNSEQLRRARPIAVISLLAAALFSQGCETVKKGVYGTEHAEITPFAQKTVEVIGVENMLMNDNELVWLRIYADKDFVELDRMQTLLADLDFFRSQIISYSVELVRITELYGSGKPRVEAFADSVDENLRGPVIDDLGVPEQQWDAVMQDIREQKDFLGALRAFQPIVNTAGDFYDGLVDEIEYTVLNGVRVGFDKRIQKDFADANEFGERHYRHRNEIFRALNYVDAYQRGDENAIVELRRENFPIDPELLEEDKPDFAQTRKLQLELQAMLAESTQVRESFDKDINDYVAVYSELDAKVIEVLNNTRIARLQFHSWARAHQALANGVKEPGKWMELAIKAGSMLPSPF